MMIYFECPKCSLGMSFYSVEEVEKADSLECSYCKVGAVLKSVEESDGIDEAELLKLRIGQLEKSVARLEVLCSDIFSAFCASMYR